MDAGLRPTLAAKACRGRRDAYSKPRADDFKAKPGIKKAHFHVLRGDDCLKKPTG
jgi:hypothetical protein